MSQIHITPIGRMVSILYYRTMLPSVLQIGRKRCSARTRTKLFTYGTFSQLRRDPPVLLRLRILIFVQRSTSLRLIESLRAELGANVGAHRAATMKAQKESRTRQILPQARTLASKRARRVEWICIALAEHWRSPCSKEDRSMCGIQPTRLNLSL